MKTFALSLFVVIPVASAVALQDDETMHASPKLEQHEWLQQLVGEWSVTSEATMVPGAEPMRVEATESVRSIGDLWVVAEGEAEIQGMPVASVLTLGYDPDQKAFVGTWIDSMQTHMWTYVGQLDGGKRVLTLETEGPSFGDPGEDARYREQLEVLGPDRRTFTSSVQGADGEWTTFMRAEYRRKK